MRVFSSFFPTNYSLNLRFAQSYICLLATLSQIYAIPVTDPYRMTAEEKNGVR